jgi:GNAT superfamily N-acetyltransferase
MNEPVLGEDKVRPYENRDVIVRHWREQDIPAVLPLMRELAVFEQYLESFAANESILLEQGFKLQPPNFYVLVAEVNSSIQGVLVYYFVPYTASAKPMLFIKELFISDGARGQGIGRALMRQASKIALEHNCVGMKWTVADWNEPAKKFYTGLGAQANPVWIEYTLTGQELENLQEGNT